MATGPLLKIAAKSIGFTMEAMVRQVRHDFREGELQKHMQPHQTKFRRSVVPKVRKLTPRKKGKYARTEDAVYIGWRKVHVTRKPGTLRGSVRVRAAKHRGFNPKRLYVRINNYPTNLLIGAKKFRGRFSHLRRDNLGRMLLPEIEAYHNAFMDVLDGRRRRV